MPVGIGTAVTGLLGAAGVGAATADIAGAVLGPALLGAGAGAGLSALEGKSPGKGALFGGLTGGALGAVGPIASGLGITSELGTGALDVLAGAGAGAAATGISGGDVGKGALFGGAVGGADALLSSLSGPGAGAAQGPSGNAPAAGGAAGGGQAAATAGSLGTPDLTSTGVASTADLGAPSAAPTAAGGVGVPGIDTISVTANPATAAGGLTPGNALTGAVAGATGIPDGVAAPVGGVGVSNLPDVGTNSNLSSPVPTTGLNAPSPGGGAGSGGPSSVDTFFKNPTLGNAGKILTSKPGTVLSAGALGLEALMQPSLPSQSSLVGSLKSQADQLNSQGSTLQNYINNGTLPPGAMAAIQNAARSAKATVRSKFAAMGLTGSTAEASELAGIDQQVGSQIVQTAQNLLEAGIKESGLSTQLYESILGETDKNQALLSSAISNFAASIAGGGSRAVTLNLGG